MAQRKYTKRSVSTALKKAFDQKHTISRSIPTYLQNEFISYMNANFSDDMEDLRTAAEWKQAIAHFHKTHDEEVIGSQKRDPPKSKNYATMTNRGSLQRFYDFAKLRTIMHENGISLPIELQPQRPSYWDKHLSLAENLKRQDAESAVLPETSSKQEFVYEYKLSVTLDNHSMSAQLLGGGWYMQTPERLAKWLRGLADFVEREPDKVAGRYEDVMSPEEWRERDLLGAPAYTRALLDGINTLVEVRDHTKAASTLLVLDSNTPPAELADAWDRVQVARRVDRALTAFDTETWRNENSYLDEAFKNGFREYWLKQYHELPETVRAEAEALDEEPQKQWTDSFIEGMATQFSKEMSAVYRAARREEAQQLRQKNTELVGSEKRPRGKFERQSEVLARVAFEVCLEGTYYKEPDYLQKVAERFEKEARRYNVTADYYAKTHRPLETIRGVLNRIEWELGSKNYPSPFRRQSEVIKKGEN